MANGGCYLFFAAFFFAAFAFFAISNPSLHFGWICEYAPYNPAHSAAWHVGPGVGDPSLRGLSPGLDCAGEQQLKKNGVLIRAPLKAF